MFRKEFYNKSNSSIDFRHSKRFGQIHHSIRIEATNPDMLFKIPQSDINNAERKATFFFAGGWRCSILSFLPSQVLELSNTQDQELPVAEEKERRRRTKRY